MTWSFAILSAILFVFFVYIGFLVGQGVCERFVVTTRDYWRVNILGVLAAIVVSALLGALPLLYAVLIGLLAGYIVGLKLTFGGSPGPWKKLDRFLRVDRKRPGAARPAPTEETRRRRRAGEAPDLMSVEREGPAAPPSRRDRTHGRTNKQ